MMLDMNSLLKVFFKTLRVVLGPVMLLWEIVSRPARIKRSTDLQMDVDRQCLGLALYQFRTCPFCIKVRKEVHRLSLNIERHDAQYDERHRADLVQGCGSAKVPCLKITDNSGEVQWLNDSKAIIAYLHGRFANSQ